MSESQTEQTTELTARQAWLLREIRTLGGRWKTGRARTAYSCALFGDIHVDRVRHDLQVLHRLGHLRQVDERGVRYYLLREDGDA